MSATTRRQPYRHAHRVVPPSRNHAHRVVTPRRGLQGALPVLALAVLAVLTLGAVAVLRPGAGPSSVPGLDPVAGIAAGGDGAASMAPDPARPPVQDRGILAIEGAACALPTSAPVPSRRPGAGSLPPPVKAAHPRSYAVVIGDSYSSGWNGVGEGSRSWAAILGATQDWRITNLAVPGIGYVNPGWTSDPVRTQVAAAIRLRPGIVIVASGHNDERYDAATVNQAADAALSLLRTGLPKAVIVVVGPIWPDDDPDPTVVALRDHLRGTAAGIDAMFIDPIGAGWFSGANHADIGSDGTHPTTAGYRRIATLLLAAFRSDSRLAATPLPSIVPVVPAAAPTPTPLPAERMIMSGDIMACAG